MPHRSRTSVLAAAVALAMAAMCVFAGSASAGWGKPRPVRGDTKLGPDRPFAGIDDEGGAVVAWTERPTRDNVAIPAEGRVRIAFRDPGDRFGKPLKMPELGAKLLDVAVGPDGTAAVAYTVLPRTCQFLCDQPLRVVVRDEHGDFGKPVTVAAKAFGGQVEVDGKGVITAAWTTADVREPRTAVAERKPRRSFGKATLIPGAGGFEGPGLAVNERGDAVATWTYGTSGNTLFAAYRKAGRAWGPTARVGAAFNGRAAIADNGDAVVMWAVNGHGYAAFRTASGKFSLGEELPNPLSNLSDVEMDADGTVLASFQRQDCTINCDLSQGPTFTNLVVTRSARTGSWREQVIPGSGGEEGDFALDEAGTAYGLFTVFGNPNRRGGTSVASARRGRSFGGKQTLTTAAAWNGVIEVNDMGNAIAAWVQGAPGGSVVASIRE